MKYVEIVAAADSADAIAGIASGIEGADFRLGARGADGMQSMRLVVADEMLQPALDALQNAVGSQIAARIVVLRADLLLPKVAEGVGKPRASPTAAREEIYERVAKDARLDSNFIVLVLLSTAVAAIGLIEDNVAVVIGAMVIAPLLGPNLAFGLATALGDVALMRKSALTALVGIALSVAFSALIAIAWPFESSSRELAARTAVGLDSVVLALASGAAAALSLTTGLSSVLVGVMVAVALLPPAAALGLMLGHGQLQPAFGAGLMLAVNVVCVNLASKLVFVIKGIHPRTWWEKEKARRAMSTYVLVWLATLAVLLLVIYLRRTLSV